jgi:predicted nucleic acid-binding protein
MYKIDKVFLDTGILFSATYRPDSRISNLWSIKDAELVTSLFALEEVRRNLMIHKPDALTYLDKLSNNLTIVDWMGSSLPKGITLAEKDTPILSAALHSRCSHLITSNQQYLRMFFRCSIEGILILTPAQYLKCRFDQR